MLHYKQYLLDRPFWNNYPYNKILVYKNGSFRTFFIDNRLISPSKTFFEIITIAQEVLKNDEDISKIEIYQAEGIDEDILLETIYR
ncbi:hypothetical protein GXP67_12565 [Rhodocytophaga rosea]|uniref:Uncharacterized protein n=1 Tax=Rhodocytophaga rosea TaxID=2704465 RepID=A0A6C0GHH9_9BACT|nr:hypothetical protein [Rhodocytophaga rosea]QHT67407.1 hypothetical protein GXP67_12565 [Rhodocytophaga rosea]